MIKFTFVRLALAAIASILVACSMLNRTGPDVSCAELRAGAINACTDGIIATCVAGNVLFHVCGDSSACEQSWQQPNAYRCSQTDPLPMTQ